jgi:hypothetical protein
MNILGKFTIHQCNPDILVIHRDPGLFFWLFMLMYFGFFSCLSLLCITIIWEARLPRTLTCQQQQQAVNCEYVIPGFISGNTIEIPNTKKAIASQTPNGETIVLTSSKPWMVLEPTSNNIQNIQSINQGLAKLNNGEKIWKLDIYAFYENVTNFFGFFLLPLGLLLFILGIRMVFSQGSTYLELDVKANTVSLINLGKFRSQLSLLNQLRGADSPVYGHLGILSDKFGIYGGDRGNNYRKIRLLFTNRRPFILGNYQHILHSDGVPGVIGARILGYYQQTFQNDGGQEVIGAINSFMKEIESRQRRQRLEG